MKHDIDLFMERNFMGMHLKPPLFYRWPYGIRFEIAKPWADHEEPDNLRQMKERSLAIFNRVFSAADNMVIAADVTFGQKKRMNLFKKCVKQKTILRRLQHRGDSRFYLRCTKGDIRFGKLLSVICAKDFSNPGYDFDIYFLNASRKMVFHLYDDRGCDVIAARKEDLEPLYRRLNEWILDVDRDRIDRLFANK